MGLNRIPQGLTLDDVASCFGGKKALGVFSLEVQAFLKGVGEAHVRVAGCIGEDFCRDGGGNEVDPNLRNR